MCSNASIRFVPSYAFYAVIVASGVYLALSSAFFFKFVPGFLVSFFYRSARKGLAASLIDRGDDSLSRRSLGKRAKVHANCPNCMTLGRSSNWIVDSRFSLVGYREPRSRVLLLFSGFWVPFLGPLALA